MIRAALFALLLLLTPALAGAHSHEEENWYSTGSVILAMPVLVRSPGHAEVTFRIPVREYYITEPPSFRSCAKWTKQGVHGPWDAQPIPTLDHYVTITPSYKTDYRAGTRVFNINDSHPVTEEYPEGREQWFCVRLPFVQMEE